MRVSCAHALQMTRQATPRAGASACRALRVVQVDAAGGWRAARRRPLCTGGAARSGCSGGSATKSAPNSTLSKHATEPPTGQVNLGKRSVSLGLSMSAEELRVATAAMDKNSDGRLDLSEYRTFVSKYRVDWEKGLERQALRSFIESTSKVGAMQMLRCLDYFGTAVFAMTGTVVAASGGFNPIACGLVAAVTSMGGGTMLNLLTGSVPVFWMRQPRFVYLVSLVSAVTFIGWPLVVEDNDQGLDSALIFWGDTLGLAAFSVIGAQAGIRLGFAPIVCCAGGVLIVFGGIIRDVLCDRHLAFGATGDPYQAATLLGACVYVGLRQMPMAIPLVVRIVSAMGSVVRR